ncbi:cytochrome P450 [Mycena maculata]|uniref:Cytochrome P450 n=1 Tax=Mycena maculata TaxID=230809 RepID=A0AAD7J9A7_9AGAR|nr:cytochrome P450 [Mycena maculata]
MAMEYLILLSRIAPGITSHPGRSRDLLSLLVRTNTTKDNPQSKRLSDAEVPTFLVAGHETTSPAATWALCMPAENVEVQTRLRNELLTLETDEPSMEELSVLRHLDCVVRETLRLYAPIVGTLRIAVHDDVIPLATPITDLDGTVHESIRPRKGQSVLIPLFAMNRDKAIWGLDAREFISLATRAPAFASRSSN